jgi:hypothetical protein
MVIGEDASNKRLLLMLVLMMRKYKQQGYLSKISGMYRYF